jgi:hypothetical protein
MGGKDMALKDLLDLTGKEKLRKKRTKTVQTIAVGVGAVVAAAAAGVATGILIAPKPGRETREDLKQTCIHGMSRQTCCACESEK